MADHIAVDARIVLCGSVATYNALEPLPGPSDLIQLVTCQDRLEGLMTHLNHDRYPQARHQLLAWEREGRVPSVEHPLAGIGNVGVAFSDLFEGRHRGKTVGWLKSER